MNATEQRQHRTVTASLSSRLEDVEAVTERLLAHLPTLVQGYTSLQARVNQLEDRLLMQDEEIATLKRQLVTVATGASGHIMRPFWSRVRWILRGV